MPNWVCEKCGEHIAPLHYHPASTPEAYGRWYCFVCWKIVDGYKEKVPISKEDKIKNAWTARKSNEH